MTIMVPILDKTELNLMISEEESCDEIHTYLKKINVWFVSYDDNGPDIRL